MAVHAPGDDDGSDPGMWARLMNYINPVGAAQAAPAPAAPPAAAFQGPGTQSQSGGWPVNQAGQPQYAIPPTNQAMANPGSTNSPGILPFLNGGPAAQGGSIMPYLNPNTAALANAASINTDLGGGSSGGGGASGGYPPAIPIGGGPGNTMQAPTGTPAAPQPNANAAASTAGSPGCAGGRASTPGCADRGASTSADRRAGGQVALCPGCRAESGLGRRSSVALWPESIRTPRNGARSLRSFQAWLSHERCLQFRRQYAWHGNRRSQSMGAALGLRSSASAAGGWATDRTGGPDYAWRQRCLGGEPAASDAADRRRAWQCDGSAYRHAGGGYSADCHGVRSSTRCANAWRIALRSTRSWSERRRHRRPIVARRIASDVGARPVASVWRRTARGRGRGPGPGKHSTRGGSGGSPCQLDSQRATGCAAWSAKHDASGARWRSSEAQLVAGSWSPGYDAGSAGSRDQKAQLVAKYVIPSH